MNEILNFINSILVDYIYRGILISVGLAVIFYIVYRIIMKYVHKVHMNDKIKFSLDNRAEQLILQLVRLSMLLIYVFLVLMQFGVGLSTIFVSKIFTISSQVVLYLVIGLFAHRFGSIAIEKIFLNSFKGDNVNRQLTITKLVQSVMKYFIWFVVGMGVLDAFGVDTTTILASASILGVAIGFGAQDLVKDIIRGFFIIFEGQFQIGDIVEVDGFKGRVKELGLKTTRIQSWTGEIKIISNGNINTVVNFSQDKCISVVDVGVDYGSDVSVVNGLINDYIKELKDSRLHNQPTYLGVQELADSAVVLRIVFEADYNDQFPIRRMMLEDLKRVFDANDVSIPFPQVVVHRGE